MKDRVPNVTPAGELRLSAAHREWGARVLGLDPALPADALAAAALRRLSRDDFSIWRQGELAVRVLAGGSELDFSDADREQLEQAVPDPRRGEIDEFCGCFFQLPVEERRRRHSALQRRCADSPVLARRMGLFHAGLNVELPAALPENPDVSSLIAIIYRCFLVWPHEAGRLRRSHIRSLQGERLRWRTAARQLHSNYPAIAQLEPDLVGALTDGQAGGEWNYRTHAATREVRPPQPKQSRLFKRNRVQARPQPSARQTSPGCLIWIGVMALTSVLRSCDRPDRQSNYRSYETYPPTRYMPGPGSSPFSNNPSMSPEVREALQRMLEDQRTETEPGTIPLSDPFLEPDSTPQDGDTDSAPDSLSDEARAAPPADAQEPQTTPGADVTAPTDPFRP